MKDPIRNEDLLSILKLSAGAKYGEEQAKDLEPSLEALSRSLAQVEDFPVDMEEEPAFFG